MSKLLEKQCAFTELVGDLLHWAYENGFDITFGEAYRPPEQAAWNQAHGVGIGNSLHMHRLAIDLNLFSFGEYQTSTDAYRPLGDYWKSLHPDARWGGDFSKPDGNHFSLSHNGVA